MQHNIADLLEELNKTHSINGVISIEQETEILYRKAFGYSSLEYNIPNTCETKFFIGSNTKLFTAVAIHQLIENGIIDYDSRIMDFFPDYSSDIDSKVTIHHLLSHTSGFKDYSDLNNFDNYKYIEIDQDAILKTIFSQADYELLNKYKYSNLGYYILGAIIEKLSNLSYSEYITKKIFKPLGMNNSGIYHQTQIIKNLATGYKKYMTGLTSARYFEMRKWFSSAGIYSTISDLNKWLAALSADELISADSFRKICTSVDGDYGYGCLIPETRGIQYLWHNGFIKGHYSYIRLYPSIKTRMLILRNSSSHNSETPDELNTSDVCSEVARIIGL